jgi:acetyl/propionyl-CoA carboxylase alpha subunit
MLAKLIVWAEDRERALARMRFALDETVILGLGSNQSYLRALCESPDVIKGKVTTHFLNEFKFKSVPDADELKTIAQGKGTSGNASPWALAASQQRPGGWTIVAGSRVMYHEAQGRYSAVMVTPEGGRSWFGRAQDQSTGGVSGGGGGDSDLVAQFPGKVRKVLVKAGQKVKEGEPLVLIEAMKMEFSVKAPSDGKISRVLVKDGEQISPGTRFVDLESAT